MPAMGNVYEILKYNEIIDNALAHSAANRKFPFLFLKNQYLFCYRYTVRTDDGMCHIFKWLYHCNSRGIKCLFWI